VKRSKFKWPLYIIFTLLPIGLFISLTYFAYNYTIKPLDVGEIPFIKRDLTPLRVKPINSGGVQFSNQDKMIYEQISDSPPIKEKPRAVTKVKSASPPDKKAARESVFDVIDGSKNLKNHKIRLATLNSRDSAEKEWQRLLRKYPTQLKNIKHRITMKNHNGKNSYSLELISLSKEQATAVCKPLSIAKQKCTILEP
jgi:hypothetical protein